MIICLTFLILILAVALVVLLDKADKAVIQYHRKFIGEVIALAEEIKDVRKKLHDVNKFVRFITQKKIINIYKIITKALDVLSVLLLFTPIKNKNDLFKRFFSIKTLKYAFSLYKTITA